MMAMRGIVKAMPVPRGLPLTITRVNQTTRFRPSAVRCYSLASPAVEPPNVLQLADKARIKLSPEEAEVFRPELEQIIKWFAQLQEVDLENIAPAIRAGDVNERQFREDQHTKFEQRDVMLDAIPEAEGPYIKVPKILNENME